MSHETRLFPYIEHTSQEAMGLLVEARDYSHRARRQGADALPPARRLLINCEIMRLVSRLAKVMAWVVERRVDGTGVSAAGRGRGQSLLANAVCMDVSAHGDSRLPAELRVLLERSLRLYMRVARLDELVRSGRPETSEPVAPGAFHARLVVQ